MKIVAVIMAALVVAACGTGAQGPAAKARNDYGLIQAGHAGCQEAGNKAASYLDTGRPTDLDAVWGNQRQQVLQLSGERRALYIRQLADGYIEQCDQAESQDEAAAAAKAAADAQAQEDARQKAEQQHQAQVQAKEQATCSKIGGSWVKVFGSAGCQIDYRSAGDGQIYHYAVSFDSEGNIVPALQLPENASAEACAAYGQKSDFRTTWHADTMICAI